MEDPMSVKYDAGFSLDEGYISSDMSPSPKKKRSSAVVGMTTTHSSSEAANLGQFNEMLMQKINSLHMDKDNLEMKNDQLEEDLHTLDLKNEVLERENRDLNDRIQAVSSQLQQLQQQVVDKQQFQRSIQENDRELCTALQRAQELDKVMASSASMIGELSRRLEQLTLDEDPQQDLEEPARFMIRHPRMEAELQRLSHAVNFVKHEIAGYSSLIDKMQREEDNLQLEGDTLRNQKQKLDQDMADKLAKLNNELSRHAEEDICSSETDTLH